MQDILSTGMFVTGQLKVLLGLIQDLLSSGVYYAVLAVNVRSDVMQKLKDLRGNLGDVSGIPEFEEQGKTGSA